MTESATNSGGAPAGAPDSGGDSDWRAALPDDLKSSPVLGKYKSPEDAFRANISLEKRLGDQASYIPKPNWEDREKIGDYFKSIGRPEKADDYDLGAAPEGVEIDDGMKSKLMAAFHAEGLHPTQAKGIFQSLLAAHSDERKQAEADATRFKQEQEQVLRTEWGGSFSEKMALVGRAAEFGWGKDTLEVLKRTGLLDDAEFVKGLAKIGETMTEHKIDLAGQGGAMQTPEAARAKINSLMKGEDPEWMKAYKDNTHPKHAEALQEWENLHRIELGEQPKP